MRDIATGHMFLSWVYNAFDFDAAFYGTNLKRQEYYEDLKKAFQKKKRWK